MAEVNVAVGFSTSPAWYSRFIRWVTGARCSHAFLVVDLGGVQMVLEEAAFGYSMCTLSNKVTNSQVVAIMPVQDKCPRVGDAVIKSMDWLGQRYDYTGLFGMAVVELGRFLKHKWRNPFASGHTMFCSESVTRVLQDAGYPNASVLVPNETDPEMLRKFLCISMGVDP